jgi:RNA polymerase sigma-70 factor (ECF subfamily)
MSATTKAPATMEDLARRWVSAQPVVAAFISLIVRDFHDAQDVLQEVAAAVLSRDVARDGLPDAFDAWIIGVARHKAIDWYRKSAGHRVVFDNEALDQIASACADAGRDAGPRQEALERCLKKVSGKSREVLDMRYRDDLTSGEIAENVGMTDTAVRVVLHRIRWALRYCIERRIARGAS